MNMYSTLDLWLLSFRSLPGEMDETDALRSKRCNEDAISLAPSETIFVEGELNLSFFLCGDLFSACGVLRSLHLMQCRACIQGVFSNPNRSVCRRAITPFLIKLECVGEGQGNGTSFPFFVFVVCRTHPFPETAMQVQG